MVEPEVRWSGEVETTGDTPSAGAGTLPGWTGVRGYGGRHHEAEKIRDRVVRKRTGLAQHASHSTEQKRTDEQILSGHEIHRPGERQRDWIECRTTRRDRGVRECSHPLATLRPMPNTFEK